MDKTRFVNNLPNLDDLRVFVVVARRSSFAAAASTRASAAASALPSSGHSRSR